MGVTAVRQFQPGQKPAVAVPGFLSGRDPHRLPLDQFAQRQAGLERIGLGRVAATQQEMRGGGPTKST